MHIRIGLRFWKLAICLILGKRPLAVIDFDGRRFSTFDGGIYLLIKGNESQKFQYRHANRYPAEGTKIYKTWACRLHLPDTGVSKIWPRLLIIAKVR